MRERLCQAQVLWEEPIENVILECEKRYGHKKKHKATWTEDRGSGVVFDVKVKWGK